MFIFSLTNVAMTCPVLEEINLNLLYIYLLNKYLLSTCLPRNLLRDREVNVNMIKLVLSGSWMSIFSGTVEGEEKAGNNI